MTTRRNLIPQARVQRILGTGQGVTAAPLSILLTGLARVDAV